MTRNLGYVGVTLLWVTLGGTSLLTAVAAIHGSETSVVKTKTRAVRPDLTAIFNGNYRQNIDHFGTVVRAAFDVSGRRIGVQIGTYRPDLPNGMLLEMTYLEPDAEHPLGQAFDGAANPLPLHTDPRA